MTNAFYIVQVRDNWFRLHLTETHYCIGATDSIDSLLNTVVRLTKKYRRPERLLKAMSKLEDGGKVYPNMLEVYESDYSLLSGQYKEVVADRVHEALEEVKFDTPLHRSRKRAKLRKAKMLEEATVEESTPVEDSTKPTEIITEVRTRASRVLKHRVRMLSV